MTTDRTSYTSRLARRSTARAALACATLAACAFAATSAQASNVTPPRPPAGHELVLNTTGIGSQIYECQTNGTWALRSPRALLTDEFAGRVIDHYGAIDRPGTFAGPGPIWQSRFDGSAVRGRVIASVPNPGSIPLLLLDIAEYQGSGMMRDVSYIVRDNTFGGVAPTGSCTAGTRQEVRYAASYRFYAPAAIALRGIPAALIPQNQSLRFTTLADGFQIYECTAPTATPNVFTWRFQAPSATLDSTLPNRAPVGLHYGGILVGRNAGPWWELGRNGATVRGAVASQVANAGTIPSLLLNIVERDGSHPILDGSSTIVRYNLTGGVIPTTACQQGQVANVPYTATYAFFGAAVE